MADLERTLGKPKLLFEVKVERRPYWRRFRFLLIIALMAALAWYALGAASARVVVDQRAVSLGRLVAAAIVLLAGIRAAINLVRWRTRANETIRFLNQGFLWETRGHKHQYRWEKLHTFREGNHGLYVGQRALFQWGSLTFVMADKRVYRLLPRHGDLRQMARLVRPFAAEVTGIQMGRRLRQEKPVRVHPKLVVWPGGLQVGKKEFPWRDLSVMVKGSRLIVQARQDGRVRTVRRFDIHAIDNLGGFMELATATIRNHR